MTRLDAPYLSLHTCKRIFKSFGRANDNSFGQLITQSYCMASENFEKNKNKYLKNTNILS